MFDGQESEILTMTINSLVPPMRTLRDRLAAGGAFDAVTLWTRSERWPEEIGIEARNRLWELHFKCDSNEVCWLSLLDGTRRPPRARPKAGFGFVGLLKGPSIAPLCEDVPRIVQDLGEFLLKPVPSDLDESKRLQVSVAFEEHATALDRSTLMPSGFDEEHVAALADQFMKDNPDIFNHPRVEVRNIHRPAEVRAWLLTRSASESPEAPEFRLLCYCVFRTVQGLCHRARHEEAYLQHK